jgi:hypothetical protein
VGEGAGSPGHRHVGRARALARGRGGEPPLGCEGVRPRGRGRAGGTQGTCAGEKEGEGEGKRERERELTSGSNPAITVSKT